MRWTVKIGINTLTVLLVAVAAAASDQPFRPGGKEPACSEQTLGETCWMELKGHHGCYVWNPSYFPKETGTWSAGCAGGLAQGTGTLAWKGGIEEYKGKGLLRAGKQHGHWFESYKDGTVAEGPYKDGRRDNHWVWRWQNGTAEEGPYVDGRRYGHWVLRYGNGTVQEGPYVDGEQHGRWITRWQNGTAEEGPYVDGKKHGRWVTRYPNGKTRTETCVKDSCQFE